MKKILLLLGVLGGILVYDTYHRWAQEQDKKCLFFRNGQCITCENVEIFPVGYKEACVMCQNRTAYYVEEGLFPVWQCGITPKTDDVVVELPLASISSEICPKNRPLKDILGNCYSCEADIPIKIAHADKGNICGNKRYLLPDQLLVKSMKCPSLEVIKDAEMCISCGGIVGSQGCTSEGSNRFCMNNDECNVEEWCYPFKLIPNDHQGVCAPKSEFRWLCSETDGYDLKSTQAFCSAQNAHIPTMEEIENANEDLSERCPTLDMWAFFMPDGAVWLESFTQEFLFTREGESQKLGGHTFHALCHKD